MNVKWLVKSMRINKKKVRNIIIILIIIWLFKTAIIALLIGIKKQLLG